MILFIFINGQCYNCEHHLIIANTLAKSIIYRYRKYRETESLTNENEYNFPNVQYSSANPFCPQLVSKNLKRVILAFIAVLIITLLNLNAARSDRKEPTFGKVVEWGNH